MSDISDDELVVKRTNKRYNVFDSDDDDEQDQLLQTSKVYTDSEKLANVVREHGNISIPEEECVTECTKIDINVTNTSKGNKHVDAYLDSDLYDAEVSDEESQTPLCEPPDLFNDNDCEQSLQNNKERNKTKPKAIKNKGNSRNELLDIKRETQRMIRESSVRLPYHQPKQRSLTEFLERRKSLLSIPIKASVDQLHQACNRLQKIEKEAELFFKSDSDDSDTETRINSKDMSSSLTERSKENYEDTANRTQQTAVSASDVATKEASLPCTQLDTKSVDLEDTIGTGMSTNTGTDTDKSMDLRPVQSEIVEFIDIRDNVHEAKDMENVESSEPAELTNEVKSLDCSLKFVDQNECNVELKNLQNSNNNSETVDDENIFTLRIDSQNEDTIADTSETQKNNILASEKIFSDEPGGKETVKFSEKVSKRDIAKLLSQLPSLKMDENQPEMIEFESDEKIVEKPGVVELMKKFIKHTAPKIKTEKKTVELSVISAEKDSGGEITDIRKEVLTVLLDKETEPAIVNPKFARPGAKYALFKEHIQKTMAEKKEARWKEYQERKKYYYDDEWDNSETKHDKESCELEFEPAYLLNGYNDEELEEDDMPMIEKEKRDKNEYVDDEAEETDEEIDADEISDSEVSEISENLGSNPYEPDDPSDCYKMDKKTPEDGNENRFEESAFEEKAENSEGGVRYFSIFQAKKSEQDVRKMSDPDVAESVIVTKNTTTAELEEKLAFDDISSQSEKGITESQVLDICSGQFVSQPPLSQRQTMKCVNYFDMSQSQEFDSQDLVLTLPEEESQTEVAVCKSHEHFSEDSDNEELFVKKRQLQRIQFSDDEDEEETGSIHCQHNTNHDATSDNCDDRNADYDNDANDNCESGDDEENGNGNGEQVYYDSEEEVMAAGAKQFFENEAELSGSEWDSGDENEKDLDELEEETGDKDDIDAEKLKEELGKIHMRQLLDDDQKDIRLLQEMLLEDGELYSETKRQRKFQWKNLDGDDFVKVGFDDSDENATDNEEEIEENWRRLRHEREMFLSQQETWHTDHLEENKDGRPYVVNENDFVDEEISKPDQIKNVTVSNLSPKADKSGPKSRFGSFLTRSSMVLSRLAISVNSAKDNNNGPQKHNRNFVFGAKTPTEGTEDTVEEGSQKAEKRKTTTSSSAVKRFKMSSTVEKRSDVTTSLSSKGFLSLLVNDT